MDVVRDRAGVVIPAARIGKTVHIQGEVHGDEDLIIDGTVEGKVLLKKHRLTIGATGKIRAEVRARWIVLSGQVDGDVVAGDRLEITSGGRVEGDIRAPRLAIADGAVLKGTVDTDPIGAGEQADQAGTPELPAAAGKPGAQPARQSASQS